MEYCVQVSHPESEEIKVVKILCYGRPNGGNYLAGSSVHNQRIELGCLVKYVVISPTLFKAWKTKVRIVTMSFDSFHIDSWKVRVDRLSHFILDTQASY